MFDKLLNMKGWDYAGIIFKDRQPMLVDRKICNKITKNATHVIVSVEAGQHPYKDPPAQANAEHHVLVSDIQGISFYTDYKPLIIS